VKADGPVVPPPTFRFIRRPLLKTPSRRPAPAHRLIHIVARAQLLVCDDLSFSGGVRFARRHTRFVERDLPQIIERALGKLVDLWQYQGSADRHVQVSAAHGLGDARFFCPAD